MTNIQFIIQYLREYPGSRYTDITKALCAYRGKEWTRGYYSRYFSKSWVHGRYIYPGYLWWKPKNIRDMSGWDLTTEGESRAKPNGLHDIWKENV
mgnify:FL=1